MAQHVTRDKRGEAVCAAILEYIRRYTKLHREPPSYREIGNEIGKSANCVKYHLHNLENDGIVAYEENRIRSVYIVGDRE